MLGLAIIAFGALVFGAVCFALGAWWATRPEGDPAYKAAKARFGRVRVVSYLERGD